MIDAGYPIGEPVPNWTPRPVPPRIPLLGRYCQVEPLNVEAHAQQLFASNSLDSEGNIWRYLGYGPFETLAEYKAWVAEGAAQSDPQFVAIVDNATGQAVGVASYLRIDPPNGVIEIGHLCFSPPLQQTPAATEAISLMIDNAFELGYRRCEWKCNALNAKSSAAAKRYGFQFEGIFRQAAISKGRNRDTSWYAILDLEWPEIKKAHLQWLNPSNFDSAGNQITSLREFVKQVRSGPP